ncbi:hypothetical protein N8868_02960 [Candidatus Pelagibacter ubique]|nr:hypothetical protein [Candidatus Pelagibacter ubique]
MKKLLGILILGLLLSGNTYAEMDDPFKKFFSNKRDIKFYKGWIPEENVKPNYDTLVYELYRFIEQQVKNSPKYEVDPSTNPYEFSSELIEDKYIDKQLEKTALLSYLRFEDGQITVDKISPNDRFGKFIKEDTKLRSMSVGRSMASYTLAHAICEGYIDSFDTRLNDWPLLENTLYYNQKLSDILNMNSGDHNYIESSEFINSKKLDKKFKGSLDHTRVSLDEYLYHLKNTKPSIKKRPRFNYHSINSSIVLNYILFKTGNDFEKILEKTFKEKAKIKNSVFFFKIKHSTRESGNVNIQFYATRHDYLRIAKAMLDDWQNDTCEGKYLKNIFENSISKDTKRIHAQGKTVAWPFARRYAGQFQTHPKGINKDRAIMIMHGYGGQHVVIDFERSRIVVTNAIHENFNYKKIVYSVIKKGK